jgi:calcium/calmodulin-dependent protein kinase I
MFSPQHVVHLGTWRPRSSTRLDTESQCTFSSRSLNYSSISNATYSDAWAIGVITYFLLCGYTPFDRDSNLEEMQAILVADYSFTPLEYWRSVSLSAREFIKRCLTIDPQQRMTAHEALQHPFVNDEAREREGRQQGGDLLPVIKKNFNARRTLHSAIDTIRAINKLREGGAAKMMEGAMSTNPRTKQNNEQSFRQNNAQNNEQDNQQEKFTGQGGNRMEIDSRGNARGQTGAQIREQQRRVEETSRGLWGQAQQAQQALARS